MTDPFFPISFRAEMIEAGLAGRKLVTRRLAGPDDRPSIWRRRLDRGVLKAGVAMWVRRSRYMKREDSPAGIVLTQDASLQRLQDISEEHVYWEVGALPGDCNGEAAISSFIGLWNKIHFGKTGCEWDDNPLVVVMPHRWERR